MPSYLSAIKPLSALTVSLVIANSSHAANCSSDDFTAGSRFTASSLCTFGSSKNPHIEAEINKWMYGDWTLAGKYEAGSGTESGSLMIGAGSAGYDYSWSINQSELGGFDDAVFVVKQASKNQGTNWMAYLFENLSSSFGFFNRDDDLHGKGFSHIRLYTRGDGSSHNVPEIDGTKSGVALGFLLALVALYRQRRIKC